MTEAGARMHVPPGPPPLSRMHVSMPPLALAGHIAPFRLGGIGMAVLALACAAPCRASDKAPEDPTKIVTKAGLSYADEIAASGSLAVGTKFKFNGRATESGQWSLGASYLFPVTILTFSAGESELDNGVMQTQYSLGGFASLAELGVRSGRWQLFVPFGYQYTRGEQPVTDVEMQDGLPMQASSSGYIGLFVLRPLSPRVSFLARATVMRGTHDYSGTSAYAGLSWHLSARDTVGLRASYVDNSFGQKEKLGISYQHEF